MALSYRSSSSANGGSATVQTITPTLPVGWAANDLVCFVISIGAAFTNLINPNGWNVRSDIYTDSTGRSILASRTMQTGDTNPVFSWTTAGKWAWTGICLQPAIDSLAIYAGLATPTGDGSALGHTAGAFAAGGLTGASVLLTGYRAGANAATAITTTAPANWTEPASNADTSTAAGTTSGTRQVAAWHAYQLAQTGTITPGSATSSVVALATDYHVFAIEQAPLNFLPPPPFQFGRVANFHAFYY